MIADPAEATEVDVKVTVCPGTGAAGANVSPASGILAATTKRRSRTLVPPALSVTLRRTTFSPSLA